MTHIALLSVLLSVIALAFSVMALRMQNTLKRAMEEELRGVKIELQRMREAEAARLIGKAEAGLTPEQIEETTVK